MTESVMDAWQEELIGDLLESYELEGGDVSFTFEYDPDFDAWIFTLHPTLMVSEVTGTDLYPKTTVHVTDVLKFVEHREIVVDSDGLISVFGTYMGNEVVVDLYTIPPEDAEAEGLLRSDGSWVFFKDMPQGGALLN